MSDVDVRHHNMPPPHESHLAAIRELHIELEPWLTGVDITTQKQADELGTLLGKVRDAEKVAADACEEEYRPLKDAADAVKERYKPALKDAATLLGTGKQLLGTWRMKVAEAEKAKAAAAKREAERLAEEARQALHASSGDLEARIDAERMADEAKSAKIAALAAAKGSKGVAKIGNRSLRLRTVRVPHIHNARDALKWCWNHRRPAMTEAVTDIVRGAVKEGASDIDGVTIETREEAA